MRHLRVLVLLVGMATGTAPAAASAQTVRVGDASARVTATTATLENGAIVHRWKILPGGQLVNTALIDGSTSRNWSLPGSQEFALLLDSTPTSSASGWSLTGATARRGPGDAVQIVFRFSALDALELDRTWTLYPGGGVQSVSSTLLSHAPVTFRIGRYSLAELSSAASPPATVSAYHGGSDWRQDFRLTRTERGQFDDEGQHVQFQTARGSGWFLVGERRGGAMNRVGRDPGGRTWVGVDNARDVFDSGPLLSSPPNYNRVENPTWPAPIRQRTLQPNGSLFLGRAYLGVYHGGSQQAAAVFMRDFAAHVIPPDTTSVDLNSFHPWGHGPGLSDANLRPQARIFKALGGEVLMLDDQWQGRSAGDWQWSTARFPIHSRDGVPDFVKYVHSRGLKLGLWMSPAEFNPSSTTYRAHPDWACTPAGQAFAQVPDASGFGVWDMNNPALRAHLNKVIDRLIAKDKVTEFKFDYVVWVDCPPHDYLDYEDAYATWIRQLELRHPGVTFQLDETNDQRLWALRSVALGPSWFDNGHLQGSAYPARLLHDLWSAAPWLAPSTVGFGSYDGTLLAPYTPDYLMPIALLGHVTFWTNLLELTRAQRARTAWWLRWYRRNRQTLSGLVYEDTPSDPIDGKAWLALQPWRNGHGYLFVFRQGAPPSRERITLQGLRGHVRYRITDVKTHRQIAVLSSPRLTVKLPRNYSAAVLSIDPLSR